MLLQRDPEACRRQAAGIAACVHAFVAVKPEGCTVIITGFILAHLSWKRNNNWFYSSTLVMEKKP